MNKPIESAEAFCSRVHTLVGERGDVFGAIKERDEARDNAVRLALLDEVQSMADNQMVPSVYRIVRDLVAKYDPILPETAKPEP